MIAISVLLLLLTDVGKASEKAGSQALDPYFACGSNCVLVVSNILGIEATRDEILSLTKPAPDGTNSMLELSQAAEQLGLFPLGLKLSAAEELARLPAPVILHVKERPALREEKHFVLFLGFEQDGAALILDPPFPPERVPPGYFRARWSGHALVLAKSRAEVLELREELERGDGTLFWTVAGWPSTVILLMVLAVFAMMLYPAGRHQMGAP